MDMRYLAQRYEKGKAAVDQLMSNKHRYVCLEGCLSDLGQVDFLEWQGKATCDGAATLLSSNGVAFWSCVLRFTLLYMDATLWPVSSPP